MKIKHKQAKVDYCKCYNLNLMCPPKSHVLKIWSLAGGDIGQQQMHQEAVSI